MPKRPLVSFLSPMRLRIWGLFLAVVLVLPLTLALAGYAQSRNGSWGRGGGWYRAPPRFPPPGRMAARSFTFCRILYQSVRYEELGHGWNTDYPNSDLNFMTRLGELTTAEVSEEANGWPNHVVVQLTDDELFNYPFIFMSDVGTVGFTPREVEQLRAYLLRGGFLYVDDFWGDSAWEHWSNEIGKVLAPEAYPIVDVPLDHEIFRVFFSVREVPQIPSIQHWRWSGASSTSERGYESEEPHMRGIFDEDGRLMVLMTHNTDIADGWEREGEDREFFERFSLTKAYPVGINIAVYAMTH